MRPVQRIGLRGRLALALATVAIVSVALATVLANAGLHGRLDQFAKDRVLAAATHSAELAASVYRRDHGWSGAAVTQLRHIAAMNGYRLALTDVKRRPAGSIARAPGGASAPVVLRGRRVGTLTVTPVQGQALTGEDRLLHARLNRLHLLAGTLALALGLLVAGVMAPALARPLLRLTEAARRIQRGDLWTRVTPRGAPELRDLGHVLNRLAETLEHEERIRRDAAADVAHELRTPVAAIVSRIEAAQDGVLADETANLAATHTEALRLTQLVEDLGRLAEAQQPGLTLTMERLDLAELVHDRACLHRDYTRAKGVDLSENLGMATIVGDRGRITQIIDNLLSNALRYTDAGGTITVAVAEHDGEAKLEVADTGIGIAGEDLPYIFERFWRGEPSRARRTGGSGIGLAIVRELVRAHDGRVDVESKPGRGSCFRITLPAAARAA